MDGNSFSARRHAGSHVPPLQLPPPPSTVVDAQAPSMPDFPPSPPYRLGSGNPVYSIKQIADESPGITGTEGLSPLASSVNSGSSQSSQAGGVAPYTPQNTWAMAPNSSYTFGSVGQPTLLTGGYSRHVYPPSSNNTYNARSSNSPATADGLPAPPYDSVSPPFPVSQVGGGSSQSHSSYLPHSSHHHHHTHNTHPLHNPVLNSQAPAAQPSSQAGTGSSEGYGRGPPTPGYYAPATSTPQPPSFPSYAPQTPGSHHSPTTSGHGSRSIPALASSHMPVPNPYASRSYGYSSMPSNMGNVLSNMAHPGGQMTMVGGLSHIPTGYAPHHMGHLYGPPQPQNDRPFRCDVCPQSFNRNHDLKRHKRIHLAVKPFPCNDCEKSFSRKDALKVSSSCSWLEVTPCSSPSSATNWSRDAGRESRHRAKTPRPGLTPGLTVAIRLRTKITRGSEALRAPSGISTSLE